MKVLGDNGDQKAYKLDKKDEKILSHYCRNVRLPLSTIAKLVGLSRQSVEYRIEQMKKAHLLAGSRSIVNIRKLGYFSYHVFVEVHRKQDIETLIERALEHPGVNALLSFVGRFDVEISIQAKDPVEFNESLSSLFDGLQIANYSFGIILETTRTKVLPMLQEPEPYKGIKNDPSFSKSFNAKSVAYNLDGKDMKILHLLAENANAKLSDMAKKVSLTSDAIAERIRKLIASKYIAQFRSVIDYSVLGLSMQCILLSGRLPKEFDTFIKSEKSVLWAAKTVGNWDYIIYVLSKSQEEFHEFSNKVKAKFDQHINANELLFASRDYKYSFMSKSVKQAE